MKTKKMKIRLALREEGDFWNAYLARADTMDGAKLIGSIAMGVAARNQEIRDSFMVLMQEVVTLAIKEVTGGEVSDWDVRPGPESERPGRA